MATSPLLPSTLSREHIPDVVSTTEPTATTTPTHEPLPADTPQPSVETSKPPAKTSRRGIAKRPPAAKKRKANNGSPLPSPDPSTVSKKRGAAARKPSVSSTPVTAASPAADTSDAESVEDENVVYCICRKPDNHTWMIGCDGVCKDWFHGKCVGVRQEDGELLDRYICPDCTEKGAGVTTWKPMCRRGGCNRPARLKKGSESKYCCDECGETFFRDLLTASETSTTRTINKIQPKRTTSIHVESDDEDNDPGPLGGLIHPPELNSLVSHVDNAVAFRRLGSAEALTPPDSRPNTAHGQNDIHHTEHEKTRLGVIGARKDRLRNMRVALKEREDFVRMTRERAARHKARSGGKLVCGYDSRLAWDVVTFREWRDSPLGRYAVKQGTLSPPPEGEGYGESEPLPELDNVGSKMCERKTCGRHGGWAKLALQEVRFDEEQVREEMKELLAEEAAVNNAARGRQEMGAASEEIHGWVEVAHE